MTAFYGLRDFGKGTFAREQVVGNLATLGRILGTPRRNGQKTGQHDQSQDKARVGLHQPPPAISALPPVPLFRDALLSAECLYHEMIHAMPDMIRIPEILITKCNPAPQESSAS